MKKYLIINADDFGLDNDTYESTISLFKIGSISSATIMTGMPATQNAINFALKNQEKYSFGLHFNILDGHIPKYTSNDNSLVNKNGRFKEYKGHIIDSLLFKLKKKDIQKELELQLMDLYNAGIKVSHIDTHGHIHKFPPILLAMKPIISQFNIQFIRCPQNLFQLRGIKKPILNNISNLFFPPLLTPDYFFMLENHRDKNWFNKICQYIKPGITEIGIHPGGNDYFREIEQNPFFDNTYSETILKNNLELINFNFARELIKMKL